MNFRDSVAEIVTVCRSGNFRELLAETKDHSRLIVLELKRGRVGPEIRQQITRYCQSPEIQTRAAGRPVTGIGIARAYFPGAFVTAQNHHLGINLWTYSGTTEFLTITPDNKP